MRSIIEDALRLPKEEKVKLYYALQEDLNFEDNVLAEDELTPEQWKELERRTQDLADGKSGAIPIERFKQKLNDQVDVIRNKSR